MRSKRPARSQISRKHTSTPEPIDPNTIATPTKQTIPLARFDRDYAEWAQAVVETGPHSGYGPRQWQFQIGVSA